MIVNDIIKEVPKLGFGLMRLPKLPGGKDTDIDMDTLCKMVDKFLDSGFKYFDTAFMYHGGASETAIREALVKRHPRESFLLADKMPLWELSEPSYYEDTFKKQLEKAGVDYFDFYLLHNINEGSIDKVEATGGFDFLKSLKDRGLARHVGFSSHSLAKTLDGVLERHPFVEFVQTQVNYADWESDRVQARECCEVIAKHGKGLIIMEPVKGGSLSIMAPEVQKIFKDYAPDKSIASWAVRFAGSRPGLVVMLSGMSDMAQLDDNLSTFTDFKPFSEEEQSVLDNAIKAFNAIPAIECTSCKYCMTSCPKEIATPDIIAQLNDYSKFHSMTNPKRRYDMATKDSKASDCLECGVCESYCPQHLPIIQILKQAAELFE